ncbi:hypothetical protein Q1W71_23540 [Flavobacterium pectinovorum]|uniref:hypothetical protein n=1 Tax=Flavobacterium pectinovorum TaxID=29533 RepID=UPI00265ED34F|nr:hypothetical protein [Flavobacterium pectinovorum]WKL47909.1 hypothetical protein Q1W71_23540 [Flavobacterium pectinovorum]
MGTLEITGILEKLDIVEILKIGSIGLGFLLAFMSYQLIKREQEKEKPNALFLKSAQVFMFFSIVIMALGILSEFIKTKTSLSIKLGGNEININELSYSSLSSLNTNEYFINSEFGFAFKKPNKNWTNIKSEKGIDGLLKIININSKLMTKENIETELKQNRIGSLILNATYYYFENTESKTIVSVTDKTGNDIIDDFIKKESKILLDTSDYGYDTTDIEEKKEYFEELLDYRKQLLGFDSLEAKEAFLLSVIPKDSLAPPLKLPSFYTSYSMVLGLNIDKLVANEKQILAGTEITLNNVKFNKQISKFQNKKWIMVTENEKYFFIIEISYSPQISSSTDLWDNLQDTLNSFTLLTNK